MFNSVMESNIGYGGGGARAAAANHVAAGSSAPYMRSSRETYNQHNVPVMSYTQMLRMSMEEDHGAEDMGSSINCSREAAPANYCNYVKGAAAMEAKDEERGTEEGYAENDYDFTCLTLGLSRQVNCGVTSSSRVDFAPSNTAANVGLPFASSRSSSSGLTRTCTLCGTSKTPLWRSGPMGAKSLCNACGIRSKKAKKLAAASNDDEQSAENSTQKKGSAGRQAAAAAAGSKLNAAKRKMMIPKEADGGTLEMVKKKKQQPPQLYLNVCSPVKTETSSCITSPGTPSPCSTHRKPFLASSVLSAHFDDALFPKDEEQAAFLLMALSCGLVLAN